MNKLDPASPNQIWIWQGKLNGNTIQWKASNEKFSSAS